MQTPPLTHQTATAETVKIPPPPKLVIGTVLSGKNLEPSAGTTPLSSGVQVPELTEKDLAPLHEAIHNLRYPNGGRYFSTADWDRLIPLGTKLGEAFETFFKLLATPTRR